MSTYLVSRHVGAAKWLESEGVNVDFTVAHLDISTVRNGDVLIGTLPINLAADVCARGGQYVHISIDLPPSLRGMELTADTLRLLGAKLESFVVLRNAQ